MYSKLWLNYEAKENGAIVISEGFDTSKPVYINAVKELLNAGILSESTIRIVKACDESLGEEGYILSNENGDYIIKANTEKAVIYGSFRLINLLRCGEKLSVSKKEIPANPLRMLNHWDNMDGSIERGYSGSSFFFENNDVVINRRTEEYARFVASVGYNGIVINNVNVKQAACDLINDRFIDKVKALSELFDSYGVKLYLSLNYAAPIEDPAVASADPLDEKVIAWWEEKMKYIYSKIPGFAGFLVKADSEGRPGPFTYGRNQAEGANMLARAIKPYGGVIIWRCFVYNCRQDWRDLKTDRARAAYDYFHNLDGLFEENVVLQIKNGPMDFQVREPVTPLFGGMEKTNQMIEFQIAQEYTGQQRHICYLIPWFKEVLSFETYAKNAIGNGTTVKDIVSGRTYKRPMAGMCAVTNTGNDYNWTGHDLAAANLYGFGRLCFDPELSAEDIAKEWIALTFGSNEKVVNNILKMLMMSWPAYEKYNAPLGIGWMVAPHEHYGPDPDGYEYSMWGTYHKANHETIGLERNSTGTGYAGLYNEPWASCYEKVETTPDELMLFFHKMPYTHVLKSGKTIIQHIYDTHFEGAEDVEVMNSLWQELKGLVPEDSFERVNGRLEHQLYHSKEWRDVINSYFYRKTLIPDEKGRELY
ncbi:MAG: alpha-glucuronidase [Lachnospiraceae bacterium]|nr:alpha-glucuronidase [Lachnospiraceae bacterium]